ncbi:MAG: hypothetical protein V1874_01290 [Spirochaetota bacterium]
MRLLSLFNYIAVVFALLLCSSQVMAWHDATHMAIAKAAGLGNYAYLAVGADMAKEKAGEIESGNHYNNTPKGDKITPDIVLAQFNDYNKAGDTNGHLYGAIIASINNYIIKGSGSKYALYSLGFASHYIGDLSMPFHNIEYNNFNKENHSTNDGIVENAGPKDETIDSKVLRITEEIRKRMSKIPTIRLSANINKFYKEIAIHISNIANQASKIGYAMQEEHKTRLTEEEAYLQLAQSAHLLKAIYIIINEASVP